MAENCNRVFFRADGNSIIGLGHVMRLIGLVEYIRDDFNCIFLVNHPDIKLKEIIESYCKVVVLESSALTDEMTELDSLLCYNDIVVLDGYNYSEPYQKYIKSKVHKLIMIDDKANMHYYADLIINHGDASSTVKYIKEPYTKILSGLDYLIIRKEFLNAAILDRTIYKIDSVFICMGGADPFSITVKALNAAVECDFIKKIVVITGNAYTNFQELNTRINEGSKRKEIIYKENLSAESLVELMSLCELAICPASSVALEMCCVKSGLLTGIVIDNQVNLHKQLVDLNCCITLQDFNKVSVDDIVTRLNLMNDIKLVNNIMQNQKKAIDGKSSARILSEFKSLSSC